MWSSNKFRNKWYGKWYDHTTPHHITPLYEFLWVLIVRGFIGRLPALLTEYIYQRCNLVGPVGSESQEAESLREAGS